LGAGVIHELNNPLTIVNANLQILSEYVLQQAKLLEMYRTLGVNTKEIDEYLEEIEIDYMKQDLPRVLGSCREGSSRARVLVDELRRFSIASQLEVTVVDLRGLIASTVRLVESTYRNRVEFRVEFDQLPPITGVTGHIQQVFMNLIVNGCQAIAEKGVVTVRSRLENEAVMVEVADTGSGIPADVLPQIFDPYFSTKGPCEGTGLGLPITKRIIEKHGGRLEVESVVGEGTVFRVILPRECDPGLADNPGSPYEF
jgi:signal transduction histidine kinase